jgi:hypothetical protein
MIEACHATTLEGFESITENGLIIPVGLRADDEAIRSFCENDIREITQKPGLINRLPNIPFDALRELTEYFIANRPWYPNRVRNIMVHSWCIEIMYGYGMGVMLRAPSIMYDSRISENPYGFCFDLKELLERGAVILTNSLFLDNLKTYLEVNANIWDSKNRIELFMEAVNWARDKGEFTPEQVESLNFNFENWVFWWGPLSIDMATNVWKDGKIVGGWHGITE